MDFRVESRVHVGPTMNRLQQRKEMKVNDVLNSFSIEEKSLKGKEAVSFFFCFLAELFCAVEKINYLLLTSKSVFSSLFAVVLLLSPLLTSARAYFNNLTTAKQRKNRP
jgi:hypothetical protein